LPNTAVAQSEFRDGFIITNTGDTLHGQVSLAINTVNCRKCEFREKPDASVITYQPGEIAAYRILDEKYYITRDIIIDSIPEKVFLEYLVNGIVDLYYYKSLTSEYYFIEKEGKMFPLSNEKRVVRGEDMNASTPLNKAYYEVQSRKYLGMLTYLFSDAKGLNPEIRRTRFEYTALIRLTRKYHKTVCTDYECISYARSTRIRMAVEPSVSFLNSQMTHYEDPGTITDQSIGAGLGLRFKPVKIFNHWNFLMGLNWSQNSFAGQMSREETSEILRYKTIHLNHQTLSLPLMVEYSFLTGKVQPFIQAGAAGYLLLNTEHTIDLYLNEHINDYDFINTSRPDNNTYVFRPVHIGYIGCAGIRYCPSEKWYIQSKMEYSRRSSVLNLQEYYDNFSIRVWSANLALGFNIN
jgi:hypothetical protein